MRRRMHRHWVLASAAALAVGGVVCADDDIAPAVPAATSTPAPVSTALELRPERVTQPEPEAPVAQPGAVEPAPPWVTPFGGPGLGSFLDAARERELVSLDLHVGRRTLLADGGIGDVASPAAAFPDEATRRQREFSFAEGSAEFDHYDVSMSWPAVRKGAVTLSLLSGLRAISARASSRSHSVGEGGDEIVSYDQEQAIVAVPVLGTALQMDLGGGLSVSGTASTHTVPQGATLLDLTAQTGLELNPNVALTAGYQFIRSSVDVGSIGAELDQEGVFASLRIRF